MIIADYVAIGVLIILIPLASSAFLLYEPMYSFQVSNHALTGLYARWVALALFFYTFSLALIFHHYWIVSDPAAARTEASSFFGHLSMMGGMLFVVGGAVLRRPPRLLLRADGRNVGEL